MNDGGQIAIDIVKALMGATWSPIAGTGSGANRLTTPANICEVSGRMTATLTDHDGNGRLSANDELTVTMDACDGGIGVVDGAFSTGALQFENDPASQVVGQSATFVFTDFSYARHGGHRSSMTGNLPVVAAEQPVPMLAVNMRSGDSLTIRYNENSNTLRSLVAAQTSLPYGAVTQYHGYISINGGEPLNFVSSGNLLRTPTNPYELKSGGFMIVAADSSGVMLSGDDQQAITAFVCRFPVLSADSCSLLGGTVQWSDLFTAR